MSKSQHSGQLQTWQPNIAKPVHNKLDLSQRGGKGLILGINDNIVPIYIIERNDNLFPFRIIHIANRKCRDHIIERKTIGFWKGYWTGPVVKVKGKFFMHLLFHLSDTSVIILKNMRSHTGLLFVK